MTTIRKKIVVVQEYPKISLTTTRECEFVIEDWAKLMQIISKRVKPEHLYIWNQEAWRVDVSARDLLYGFGRFIRIDSDTQLKCGQIELSSYDCNLWELLTSCVKELLPPYKHEHITLYECYNHGQPMKTDVDKLVRQYDLPVKILDIIIFRQLGKYIYGFTKSHNKPYIAIKDEEKVFQPVGHL